MSPDLSLLLMALKRLAKRACASVLLSAACLLPVLAHAVQPDARYDLHTVKKGDTLWGIAGTRYHNHWLWKKIWKLNKKTIRNPNLIYPGQVFALAKPLPPESGASLPATAQAAVIKPVPNPAPAPVQPAPATVISAHIISIYTGTSQESDRMVVIIDKGRLDGVKNSQMLTLYRTDENSGKSNAATALGTGYGQIQVFRLFDKTAYATVTQANGQIKLLDTAATN